MSSKIFLALVVAFTLAIVANTQYAYRNNDQNWAYNLLNNPNARPAASVSQANANANQNSIPNSCICNSYANHVCNVRTGITYLNECEAICVKIPKGDLGQGRCGTQYVRVGLQKSRQIYSECPTCLGNRNLVCVELFGQTQTFQNECIARCHGYTKWREGRCRRLYKVDNN